MTNPTNPLLAALEKCRDQFQFYANEHTAAGKLEKAATNQSFADLASTALSSAPAVGEAVKSWEQRCEEDPDHETYLVTPDMIQEKMQAEIDDLRAALAHPTAAVAGEGEAMREAAA